MVNESTESNVPQRMTTVTCEDQFTTVTSSKLSLTHQQYPTAVVYNLQVWTKAHQSAELQLTSPTQQATTADTFN